MERNNVQMGGLIGKSCFWNILTTIWEKKTSVVNIIFVPLQLETKPKHLKINL